MTLFKQSFDLGTNGATLTAGNSGGTGVDAFGTPVVVGTIAYIYDNSKSAHGTQSLKITPASGGSLALPWSGFSSTNAASSIYIYLTALPASDTYLIRFTQGGTRKVSMHINSAGKLRVVDAAATTLWTAASALVLNTWVRCELYATSDVAGSATVTAAYYPADSGTPYESVYTTSTASGGGAAFDAVTHGKTDTGTYATAFWMDSIQFNTAASGLQGIWPVAASSSVRPTGIASASGTWLNQGGAATEYAALADESDTTYVQSPDNPTSPIYDEYAVGSLAAGDITVTGRHQVALSSPAISVLVELRQGATVISSRTYTPTTSWVTFSWALSSGENTAVTDRTNLRVRVTPTV